MKVFSGDEVSTGANSRAIIDFTSGGYILLDENTDPVLEVIQDGLCVIINIVYGQVLVKKDNTCLKTPEVEAFVNSFVNINVTGAYTIVTVLEGSVKVKGKGAEELSIIQDNEVEASKIKIESPRHLSKSNLYSTINWAYHINFDYDSAKINQSYKKILEKVVDFLKENKDIKVKIEGHSDDTGTANYNLRLSRMRAEVVKDYLCSTSYKITSKTLINLKNEKKNISYDTYMLLKSKLLNQKFKSKEEFLITLRGTIGSRQTDKYKSFILKNALFCEDIALERLKTEGKGQKFPLTDNRTEEGRRKNRRAEILLLP